MVLWVDEVQLGGSQLGADAVEAGVVWRLNSTPKWVLHSHAWCLSWLAGAGWWRAGGASLSCSTRLARPSSQGIGLRVVGPLPEACILKDWGGSCKASFEGYFMGTFLCPHGDSQYITRRRKYSIWILMGEEGLRVWKDRGRTHYTHTFASQTLF